MLHARLKIPRKQHAFLSHQRSFHLVARPSQTLHCSPSLLPLARPTTSPSLPPPPPLPPHHPPHTTPHPPPHPQQSHPTPPPPPSEIHAPLHLLVVYAGVADGTVSLR